MANVKPKLCNVTKLSYLVGEFLKAFDWQANIPDQNTLLSWTQKGVASLLIDTGRASEYDEDEYYYYEMSELLEYCTETQVMYPILMSADERRYIVIMACMYGLNVLEGRYAALFGYNTPRWSITNSDKPFANLQARKMLLLQLRRILHNRMHRYIY